MEWDKTPWFKTTWVDIEFNVYYGIDDKMFTFKTNYIESNCSYKLQNLAGFIMK